MKRALIFLSVLLLATAAANAQSGKIGATVENFSMPDTNGTVRSLNDLKGKSGSVVVFLSAQCPVVRGYNDRINQIAADYKAKGIVFIGINSNSTETLAQVKAHADEHYKFPVLIDKGNVLADKLGANSTPEVFYMDGKNVLIYHGGIDNDISGRNVSETYLKAAFDASLDGKPIAKATTKSFGCSIKRVGD